MVDDKLGSSMKSVGEVMSISRSFEEAFQKALRMANENILGFYGTDSNYRAEEDELINPNHDRMNKIANSFYSGQYQVDEMYDLTRIDKWYLKKLWKIIEMQKHWKIFHHKTKVKFHQNYYIELKELVSLTIKLVR